MTLSRQAITEGLVAEYGAFAGLVRSLSGEEWERPSRCEGWRVADVAAHVSGILADVAHLRLEGIGSQEVNVRQVEERRERTPGELADEIDGNVKVAADLLAGIDDAAFGGPAPAGLAHTVGFGLEGLWYDTYVHGDDIRTAAGRPPERDARSLDACISHLAQLLTDRNWGPATLALEGVPEYPVSGGGDRRITGDALDFVRAATGRIDPSEIGLEETVNVYRD